MSGPRRFRAPTGNGEVLADPPFSEVPRLVEENRRRLDRADVVVGGLSLRELRALARREALGLAEPGRERQAPADAPLILAGHQPELSHPGVWVKHFALNGLARRVGGTPLNLTVDNDTLKSATLRFPVFRDGDPTAAHLDSLAFDTFDGEVPYENRAVHDPARFGSFARRHADRVHDFWPYEPLLWQVWPKVVRDPAEPLLVGERFSGVRQEYEQRWGCRNLDLRVSRLSQTEAFRRFAAHTLADLPRFAAAYNAAVRAYRTANRTDSANHPAPELAAGEAPFWVRIGADGRRARATAASDPTQLRPRALTLTLFARVCLGDFFIHGIGGGKYDEVTDDIIRNYFGVEPPAYQVLSATLHLPLPGFPASGADVARRERLVRDLHWNPQRHLTESAASRPEVRALLKEKEQLAAVEPPYADHPARREWFRRLQRVTGRLRPLVGEQVGPAEAGLGRVREEAAANAVLRRRDYSWVLYPEATLRPFLQRFLDV